MKVTIDGREYDKVGNDYYVKCTPKGGGIPWWKSLSARNDGLKRRIDNEVRRIQLKEDWKHQRLGGE